MYTLNLSKPKKRFLFSPLLVMALMVTAITSCSKKNALPNTINSKDLAIKPAKDADITVYSGSNALYSTLSDVTTSTATTGFGTFTYTKYYSYSDLPEQYQSAMPDYVTNDEKTYVKNYIKAHPNEASADFSDVNYFIQYAGSSYDAYAGATMKDHNGAQHSVTGSNQMDYIEINGKHINDYNAGGGPNALCQNLPLSNPAYHDSWGDVNNTKYNAYKIYKISYNGKDGYYLGFDYKTQKNSGEHFDGDGVYNDYVIKLTPADGNNQEGGNNGNNGSSQTTVTNNGEVEVNLSINDKKSEGDYIATKLSIHVRDTTDAEVFIPVPAEYYITADDMHIVISHHLDLEKYNNILGSTTMDYTIAGQTVTLVIAYELNGIRITTSGINSAVLKSLRAEYGDGLTFEVWNYYKKENGTSELTRETLQSQYLNKSSIAFTTNTGKYINAFGALYNYNGRVYDKANTLTGVLTPYIDSACTQVLDVQYWDRSTSDAKYYILHSHVNPWDCIVKPTDESYILNETEVYNKIYKK